MQVRITATFGDTSVKPQTAITDFTLTPFKPFTSTLYIVGDATPNGWDITKATALGSKEFSSNPAELTYYGQLKQGNFHLPFGINEIAAVGVKDFIIKMQMMIPK